ncbi:hypothetical protein [Serinicoccus marinus]|uniref:hypothetical protein n=1 Tax=Serinicoccus marinus TaxID=247333 RepID=UPI0024920083|nr:hypothetical protein [Serinicoccus marinus]
MNEDLRHALDQAAGAEPDLDLTDEAWRQGRGVRRRRHVAQGVGGLAAVAVVTGVFALGGGFTPPEAGVGPALPTVEDDAAASAPVQTYALPTPTPTTSIPSQTSEDAEPTATTEVTSAEETSAQGTTAAEPSAGASPVPTTQPVPTTADPAPAQPTGVPTATSTTTAPAPSPPPSSAPPPSDPPEITCSATGLSGTVVAGDAPATVVQRAQALLDAAVACDRDVLVQAATADETMLSFGLATPQEVFVLPEPGGWSRYALLVQTLTARAPVVQEGGGGTWYEWYLTDEPTGWRVGISTDGSWDWFLAGD